MLHRIEIKDIVIYAGDEFVKQLDEAVKKQLEINDWDKTNNSSHGIED